MAHEILVRRGVASLRGKEGSRNHRNRMKQRDPESGRNECGNPIMSSGRFSRSAIVDCRH